MERVKAYLMDNEIFAFISIAACRKRNMQKAEAVKFQSSFQVHSSYR